MNTKKANIKIILFFSIVIVCIYVIYRLYIFFRENSNVIYSEAFKRIINNRTEIINYIINNPNEIINIEYAKGSKKGNNILPFDYGEWPNLINPADNHGWDLIIVPSAIDKKNLIPIGYVLLNGNDKIIVAPNKNFNENDIRLIKNIYNTNKIILI